MAVSYIKKKLLVQHRALAVHHACSSWNILPSWQGHIGLTLRVNGSLQWPNAVRR